MNKSRTKRPPKRISEDYLHNAGIYYLQRFAAGTSSFRKVMIRKINRSCEYHKDQEREACAEMLEGLIVKFTQAGLLDDEVYTRATVTSLRRRGLASKAIRARLIAKGLSKEIIDASLSQTHEREDFQAAVRLTRRRKIGPYGHTEDDRLNKKSLSIMARAGFSYEVSRRVLSLGREEAEIMISGDLL